MSLPMQTLSSLKEQLVPYLSLPMTVVILVLMITGIYYRYKNRNARQLAVEGDSVIQNKSQDKPFKDILVVDESEQEANTDLHDEHRFVHLVEPEDNDYSEESEDSDESLGLLDEDFDCNKNFEKKFRSNENQEMQSRFGQNFEKTSSVFSPHESTAFHTYAKTSSMGSNNNQMQSIFHQKRDPSIAEVVQESGQQLFETQYPIRSPFVRLPWISPYQGMSGNWIPTPNPYSQRLPQPRPVPNRREIYGHQLTTSGSPYDQSAADNWLENSNTDADQQN